MQINVMNSICLSLIYLFIYLFLNAYQKCHKKVGKNGGCLKYFLESMEDNCAKSYRPFELWWVMYK